MMESIEELKLNQERAQTGDNWSKQNSELTQCRVAEMEQGISDNASLAAKAQLEVAVGRQTLAVTDLKLIKEKLEEMQGKYVSLVNERNMAVKRVQEAMQASKVIEKTVEELTSELIMAKETLESAYAAHLEAEGKRVFAAMAREQDSLGWRRELEKAENEIQKLNKQLSSVNGLKSKIEASSTLLPEFRAELASYMEFKSAQVSDSVEKEANPKGRLGWTGNDPTETQSAIVSVRKELEEVNISMKKAKDHSNYLQVADASLKLELEKEKAALATMRQMEGLATKAVAYKKDELDGTQRELDLVQMRKKKFKERMVELPRLLEQAGREANQAKSEVTLAHEELQKAKEEAEQVRVGASAAVSILNAALKEIAATKASESLALAAVKALQESESTAILGAKEGSKGVMLCLEEYHMLSKKAREAEEKAYRQVAASIIQIEVTKESELRSLEKLEAANKEVGVRKEAIKTALEKSKKAQEGESGVEVEHDLGKWRAEHEQQRKASNASPAIVKPVENSPGSFETEELENDDAFVSSPQSLWSPNMFRPKTCEFSSELKLKKEKKKRFFLPPINMFLGRKNSGSLK